MRALDCLVLALSAASLCAVLDLTPAVAKARAHASAGPAPAPASTAQRATPSPSAPSPASTAAAERWCAPELEAIGEMVCFISPAAAAQAEGKAAEGASAGDRTLVIFLHSLMGATGDFRWQQQRLVARMANAYGFTAIMPRGRPGIGPGRDPAVLAWPTASKMQEEYEDELVAEWMSAKAEAEKRVGPFKRVLVFGFSNGAYYATSLALRGRLEVDGYGVFAGGSGGKYLRLLAARAPRRAPIFVGYGTKDPDHRHQRELVSLLRSMGWEHRVKADRIGHTVSDAQIRGALAFLRPADDSK
jgi:predicted esterase